GFAPASSGRRRPVAGHHSTGRPAASGRPLPRGRCTTVTGPERRAERSAGLSRQFSRRAPAGRRLVTDAVGACYACSTLLRPWCDCVVPPREESRWPPPPTVTTGDPVPGRGRTARTRPEAVARDPCPPPRGRPPRPAVRPPVRPGGVTVRRRRGPASRPRPGGPAAPRGRCGPGRWTWGCPRHRPGGARRAVPGPGSRTSAAVARRTTARGTPHDAVRDVPGP